MYFYKIAQKVALDFGTFTIENVGSFSICVNLCKDGYYYVPSIVFDKIMVYYEQLSSLQKYYLDEALKSDTVSVEVAKLEISLESPFPISK